MGGDAGLGFELRVFEDLVLVVAGNPLQLSVQSNSRNTSASAGRLSSLSSRPCLGGLVSRSSKTKWISTRGGCRRACVVNMRLSKSQCKEQGQTECSNGEIASTSAIVAREASSVQSPRWRLQILPRNVAQVGVKVPMYLILRF